MANWNAAFDPKVLTERIEQTKIVSADGTASFPGFAHAEHRSLLASMLRLNSEVPEIEARNILNRACFAAAGAGPVTPDSLRAQVEILENKYLSTPKKRYRFLTSISASFTEGAVRLRRGTTELCFGWNPTRVAAAAHFNRVKDAERSIYGSLPRFYSTVSVLIDARNPDEAATQALDQIDLQRAIWNFWKNRGRNIRISSGNRSPVNSMILGPIHTLHTLKGDLATDGWWYEPSYLGPVSVWRENHRRQQMHEFTKYVRRALRRLRYPNVIEGALIRYGRALDSRDWNSSVLQLWSLLELLTGTSVTDSHKVTVRRVAFLFKDADYATQVLTHLRNYRNTAVHAGKESQDVEPLMYQAKNLVEALLSFHLARAGQFDAIADVAAFLDQPPGLAEVDLQIARLKAVRKYLTD